MRKARGKDSGDGHAVVLALMVLMIFITLVVTWTILGAVDEFSGSRDIQQDYFPPATSGGTGLVALTILPPEEGSGG